MDGSVSEVFERHLQRNEITRAGSLVLILSSQMSFEGLVTKHSGWEGKKKQCHNQNGF